jgi:hypothetical protein
MDDLLELMSNKKTAKRMDAKTRKSINAKLHDLCTQLYPSIPLDQIETFLEHDGYLMLQEDNTKWAGMLIGREGREVFELADSFVYETVNNEKVYTPLENAMLVLTWYRYKTGRYEVVSYVS